MCGGPEAQRDPHQAYRVAHGGRGAIGRNPYNQYYLVDKEATAAKEKTMPKGGRMAAYRDPTVYVKDEHGRNKLKGGYAYDNGKGVDTGKALGQRDIYKLGKSGERPGDPRGGKPGEAPTQVDASERRGKRGSAKSKMGQRAGQSGMGTILTGSHGLGGSAKTNKTLLGG